MLKQMQFHATHFPLYETGNTSYQLANNGTCVSTISTVTRLQVVIPSGLGSIRSNGIPYG